MTLTERIKALDNLADKAAMKNERPTTKRDVEHFLWDCSNNDLISILLWTVGEVCVRFYKSKHSDCKREESYDSV